MKQTTINALGSLTLVGALVFGAGVMPAHAAPTTSGTCAGARFDLSAYPEDGGYEVEVEIDHARPASTWRFAVTQNGRTARAATIRTSAQGYFETGFLVRNAAGVDTFVLRVKPLGSRACSVRLSMP